MKLRKMLALVLAIAILATLGLTGVAAEENISIDVLVTRHNESTTDAADEWFFKYMEYLFAQDGQNVTINVSQVQDNDQVALLLGTDSLPDVIWGYGLTTTQAVRYGMGEEMILDWTPYINEENMPNVKHQFDLYPDVLAAVTAPNGAIYGIPYFKPFLYSSGTYGVVDRLFLRQSWLDAVNLEVPTTEEELLDMLRAFKDVKNEEGLQTYPLTSADNFLEKYLWSCLGYYGSTNDYGGSAKFGGGTAIKDGTVEMPALTKDYDEYIKILNTMYTEGLISPDYYTMDGTAARAMISNNTAGAFCYWTLGDVPVDQCNDIVMCNPILLGDNDEIYISCLSYYEANKIWASAETEYPEVVCKLVDFIYSDEGAFTYRYGPAKGEDPLGLVPGYFYDEKGDVTFDAVVDGTYSTATNYGRDILYPVDNVGLRPAITTSGTGDIITYKDAVTGLDIETVDTILMTDDNLDGHWRLMNIAMWNPHTTAIRLPSCYLDADTAEEMADIETVLNDYIISESVKFITNLRPLEEIDAFKQEIIAMGAEDYLECYRNAYADYMASIFGE